MIATPRRKKAGRPGGLARMERLMARKAWLEARDVARSTLGASSLTNQERARCEAVIAEVCSREKTRDENFRDPYRYVTCLARAAAHWEASYRLHPTATTAHEWATHIWPFGRYAESQALFEEALREKPDDPMIHTQRAEMLLTFGRWMEGFAEYERRLEIPDFKRSVGLTVDSQCPMWMGEDLTGRSILLMQEGGYGDALHMIRYARGLKERFHAARVIAQVTGPLVKLIATVEGVDEAVALPAMPTTDVHLPMMSLPHRFGTTVETHWAPYVRSAVAPGAPRTPLRVGLVWHGSVMNPGDMVRSILPGPKGNFYADIRNLVLTDLPIEWVCLQLGDAQTIVKRLPWGNRLTYPEGLGADWLETRDVLAGLDLVLGIETAVTHLSAAMGIPTWLTLAVSTAWRWMATGETSPWYPSVRLIRQTKLWEWGPVFKQVQRELRRLTA